MQLNALGAFAAATPGWGRGQASLETIRPYSPNESLAPTVSWPKASLKVTREQTGGGGGGGKFYFFLSRIVRSVHHPACTPSLGVCRSSLRGPAVSVALEGRAGSFTQAWVVAGAGGVQPLRLRAGCALGRAGHSLCSGLFPAVPHPPNQTTLFPEPQI